MCIKECEDYYNDIDKRLQERTQWIVNDLRLRLSILETKVNNDMHKEYNRWYENAIRYIEENWLD